VFAPAAAHLCNGVPLGELGDEIDPAGLMPGLFPLPREEDGGLVAEVLWVDRYGNAQLNVAPEELDALGTYFELRLDQGRHSARRADHFAAITPGGLGLVVDSTGLVALAADRSSAAEELRIGAGDPVTLVPLDADEPSAAPGVPVQLGRRPDPTTATGAEP
jgi:S-adenosylmethionine hydrolase